MAQTPDGYLWVATYDGLARFDGAHFTVLGQAQGLGANGIRALAADADGSVFAGTNGGGLSHIVRGRATRLTRADGLPADIVWSLLRDRRDGALWVGTNGGGLARLRGGRFETFPVAESGRAINAITQTQDGSLWLAAGADGLRRLAPDGRFSALGAREHSALAFVNGVAAARDGSVWAATSSGGIVHVKGGVVEPLPPGLEPLAAVNVSTVLEDREGTLWIATNGRGLARFSAGRLSFLGVGDGLSEVVYSLFEDREGTLWIGTNGAGLSQLKDGSFTAFGTREGLSRDFVHTALEDRSGVVWAGTGGGLDRLVDGRFVPGGLPLAAPVAVRTLAQDAAGALWVGTYGAGVFSLVEGRWRSYTTRDGLASENVRAVLADGKGRLWVATVAGLSVLENGAWRTLRTADGLPRESLIGLAEGRDGALWVGTDGGGLCRLRDGRVEVFTTRDGLGSDLVLALFVDADGVLWAGTNGGLSRFDGGRFRNFTAASGLPSDSVTQIQDDGGGHLWIGTSRGVSRVSKASLAKGGRLDLETFDRADGMRSGQCTAPGQPAGMRGRDGRLWFATTRGLVVVDPGRLRRDVRPPLVAIDEALVEGRAALEGETLVVPPGRKRLEIRYAVLSFRARARAAVRFRLEGFDTDWVDAGDRRRADYTGVPPGRYVFRVSARTAGTEWSVPGAALPVRVEPRFFQTGLFYVGLVLGAAGLVAGAHRLRVRRLHAREAELTALVVERTASLAAETLRAEEAREQAERLLAATRAIGSTLDLQDVLARILAELERVVPYDSASVQELRGTRVVIVGGRGFRDFAGLLGEGVDITTGDNPNGEVVRTKAPLILEDAEAAYEGFRSGPLAARVSAWLGVPLLYGERVIGMLTLDKKARGFYTEAHARLALSFAAQAAIALQNARLFESARDELAERTRVEEAMAKSEALYRDLFERSLGLICTHALDGTLLSVNPAAAASLGTTTADMVGKKLQDFMPPELRARMDDYFASIRIDGEAAGTMVVVTAAGERRVWRYRNVARTTHEGETQVIGFAQDVTEDGQARRALEESEERFRQLAENIDAAFFIRGVEPPRILYLSPAFERIWGRPSGPILGGASALLETVHPDDRSRLAAVMGTADGYEIAFRILRPDGATRFVRTRAFPVRGRSGQVERIAGIAEDVTAHREVEELRDNLTNTVVHDLKNPLTAILGSVDFLLEGGGLAPVQERVLGIARTNGRRLVSMVDTILDIGRLEGGAMPVEPERVALDELVDEVLELQRPLAEPRRMALTRDAAQGLPCAWADRALTARILTNLVGNAIKFTPPGGEVRVGVAWDAGASFLRVTVSDSGPGIPDEMRGRLFQRFASGRQGARGSGLGLSFCRLAVEAQGGTIETGVGPLPGAAFVFGLPGAPPVADA